MCFKILPGNSHRRYQLIRLKVGKGGNDDTVKKMLHTLCLKTDMSLILYRPSNEEKRAFIERFDFKSSSNSEFIEYKNCDGI